LKTLRLLEKFEDRKDTRLRDHEAARREDEDSETLRFLKKLKDRKASSLETEFGVEGPRYCRPADWRTAEPEGVKT
jgi:hypothetical protein